MVFVYALSLLDEHSKRKWLHWQDALYHICGIVSLESRNDYRKITGIGFGNLTQLFCDSLPTFSSFAELHKIQLLL